MCYGGTHPFHHQQDCRQMQQLLTEARTACYTYRANSGNCSVSQSSSRSTAFGSGVEQAETMAEAAANALLKTLEEPGQATLILLHRQLNLYCRPWYRCQRIPFIV